MRTPQHSRVALDAGRVCRRWALCVLGLGLVLAIPVATWWLVGDLSTVPATADPQYAIRPWPIDPDIARAMGVGSLVLAAAVIAGLGWASWQGLLDGLWWSVLIPLAMAGGISGGGWRVMTAGVDGANIGAGLLFLFGGPVIVSLLIWALVRSVVLLVRERHRRDMPDAERGR